MIFSKILQSFLHFFSNSRGTKKKSNTFQENKKNNEFAKTEEKSNVHGEEYIEKNKVKVLENNINIIVETDRSSKSSKEEKKQSNKSNINVNYDLTDKNIVKFKENNQINIKADSDKPCATLKLVNSEKEEKNLKKDTVSNETDNNLNQFEIYGQNNYLDKVKIDESKIEKSSIKKQILEAEKSISTISTNEIDTSITSVNFIGTNCTN